MKIPKLPPFLKGAHKSCTFTTTQHQEMCRVKLKYTSLMAKLLSNNGSKMLGEIFFISHCYCFLIVEAEVVDSLCLVFDN